MSASWEAQAMRAIKVLAMTGLPFTAWDVAKVIRCEPDNPNRWGSILSKASRQKTIRLVGYTKSARPGRSRGVCGVWEGVPEWW